VNYYPGFESTAHPRGTWYSPYTFGADAYNYNDPQEYTGVSTVRDSNGKLIVQAAGAHGNYLTSTNRCRECHATHASSGIFKLTRSDTRFEACDWCHGSGAGAGFDIKTDNNSEHTVEYGVGHSMGYGISKGNWRAPDDTYPAYTPSYWLGGFSCFDCHSPHANPKRLLGFSNNGTMTFPIYNPGYNAITALSMSHKNLQYPAGSWLLLKNPDRETNPTTGKEISDSDVKTSLAISFNGRQHRFPVHKQAIDWDHPSRSGGAMSDGFQISQFCADCHDGNAGLATEQVAMFSEDLALMGKTDIQAYVIGSGHDSSEQEHGARYFDPEDNINNGPSCRGCHRGSSTCKICHSNSEMLQASGQYPRPSFPGNIQTALSPVPAGMAGVKSKVLINVTDATVRVAPSSGTTIVYPTDWNSSNSAHAEPACCDNGFSWPHRTLGWKMLKDDLFGVDFDGQTAIRPGDRRKLPQAMVRARQRTTNSTMTNLLNAGMAGATAPAQNLDSVCLDCHNPNIWNPQLKGNLLLRGLP
jgi:hypothetical protein